MPAPIIVKPMDEMILFAIRSHAPLGGEVARLGGFGLGAVETHVWPDGEIRQVVKTPVADRQVCLVAGTGTESDTMEAFDLACALVRLGSLRLTVVIPFFGYSTTERTRHAGGAVTAKSRALLWSALPAAPLGNRILILEPHTPGLPYYFEGPCPAAGVEAGSLLLAMIAGLGVEAPVLCSPDIGRIKWVDHLAAASGRASAFVLKRRLEGGGSRPFGIFGDVAGRKVILCDDMIRSGGTLIGAARACLDAGATGVSAVAIHGAFAPGTLERLRECRLLESLACTDSHPGNRATDPGWPRVFSCAGLLAEAVKGGPDLAS